MAISLSASSGQTSEVVSGVDAGATVSISPNNGFSQIEYTTSPDADIINGVAIWNPWPKGAVSTAQSDVVNVSCAVRLKCLGGSATARISDGAALSPRINWRSTIQSGPIPASGIRTVLLGDSITNQCYTEFATGQFGTMCAGYFAHASIATYGALRMVAELGVGGDTTGAMLGRIEKAIQRYRPDLMVIMGGTNDITSQNISANQTISNLAEMARICGRYGVLAAFFTIPPKNAATDGATIDYATKHALINWALQYRIAKFPGVVVADAYSTVVDTATGLWASGMSTDGTHPLANASIRHGIALANAINPYIPTTYRAPTMAMHQLDGWNLVYNPYMAGNNASGTNGWTVSTGVTGNGPNGYNAARLNGASSCTVAKTTETASLSKREWLTFTVASFSAESDSFILRSDVNQNSTWVAGISPTLNSYRRPTVRNGYAYRCIVAGTAGGTEPTWPTTLGYTVTDGTVTWQCVPLIEPGGRFVAVCEYRISGVTGNVSPTLVASCRDSGGVEVAAMAGNRRATADALPDTFIANGVIWTPEFICPDGVNRIQVNAGFYGSSGGAATVGFTGVQLIKIPEGFGIQDLLTD